MLEMAKREYIDFKDGKAFRVKLELNVNEEKMEELIGRMENKIKAFEEEINAEIKEGLNEVFSITYGYENNSMLNVGDKAKYKGQIVEVSEI